MQLIPAVDVLDGGVVRLHRGDYDAVTTYAAEVVDQIASFGDQGCSLVHVVDLAKARDGGGGVGLWSAVCAAGPSIQAGGGIRTAAAAKRALEAGVSRVVVGTAAVSPDGPLEDIVLAVGADQVVVGLDVRDGRVRGSGWTDEGQPVEEVVARLLEAGVVRALVTGIDTDGTMAGPDHRLLQRVRSLAPDLAIIASGGVGTLDHLRELASAGWEAVIVGKALYEGAFTVDEALSALSG